MADERTRAWYRNQTLDNGDADDYGPPQHIDQRQEPSHYEVTAMCDFAEPGAVGGGGLKGAKPRPVAADAGASYRHATLITHGNGSQSLVREPVCDLIESFQEPDALPTMMGSWANLTNPDGTVSSFNRDQIKDLVSASTLRDLRRAVGGEDEDDLATLIWRAGELRRRAEDAHGKLDSLGAPRTLEGSDGRLSLAGRLDALA